MVELSSTELAQCCATAQRQGWQVKHAKPRLKEVVEQQGVEL